MKGSVRAFTVAFECVVFEVKIISPSIIRWNAAIGWLHYVFIQDTVSFLHQLVFEGGNACYVSPQGFFFDGSQIHIVFANDFRVIKIGLWGIFPAHNWPHLERVDVDMPKYLEEIFSKFYDGSQAFVNGRLCCTSNLKFESPVEEGFWSFLNLLHIQHLFRKVFPVSSLAEVAYLAAKIAGQHRVQENAKVSAPKYMEDENACQIDVWIANSFG